MAWNDVQTGSDSISHTEWNSMVSAIRYEPYDYLVYKVDTTYYAKSGDRSVLYDDTDFKTLVPRFNISPFESTTSKYMT